MAQRLASLANPIKLLRHVNRDYETTLLYLTCLGFSGIPMKMAFKIISSDPIVDQGTSTIFKKIQLLTEKWGYVLAKTLRIASKQSGGDLGQLMARLSHAVSAGISLKDFVKIEFQKFLAVSEAEFEKTVERVKRLSEAYSALLSSMGFLSVSFLLMAMIYGSGETVTILNVSVFSIAATLGCITMLFLRTNIRREVLHRNPNKPDGLIRLEKMTKPLTASTLALLISGPFIVGGFVNSGGDWAMLTAALPLLTASPPLLIHGFLGSKWVKKATSSEAYLPMLMKSLGDYITVTGSVYNAAKMMMLSDYGPLNRLIENLATRLKAGIPQNLALRNMGIETLSSLGYRALSIFGETLKAGGRASEASAVLNDFTTVVLLRDKKRKQAAGGLKGMVIPLQITLVAIFGLMQTLVGIFAEIAKLTQQFLNVMTPLPSGLVNTYFYAITLVTALVSSLNIYLTDGDSVFTFTFNAGLLLAISGASYLGVSILSGYILSSFAAFGRELTTLVVE